MKTLFISIILLVISEFGFAQKFPAYLTSEYTMRCEYADKGLLLSNGLKVVNDSISGKVFLILTSDNPKCFTIGYPGDEFEQIHEQLYPNKPYRIAVQKGKRISYITLKESHNIKGYSVIKVISEI